METDVADSVDARQSVCFHIICTSKNERTWLFHIGPAKSSYLRTAEEFTCERRLTHVDLIRSFNDIRGNQSHE